MNTHAQPAHTYTRTHVHFPGEHLPSRNRAPQSVRSAQPSNTSLPLRHCCSVLLFLHHLDFYNPGFSPFKSRPTPTKKQSLYFTEFPLCCRVGLESNVSVQQAQVGIIKWIEHLISRGLEKWGMANQWRGHEKFLWATHETHWMLNPHSALNAWLFLWTFI